MPFEGDLISLSATQRLDLEHIARSQSLPAGFVLRAKIILLLAAGCSYDAIKSKLDTTAPTISRWKKRFLEHGLDGLETHRPGQPPPKLTARLRARILNATRRKPRDGSTHWSCRKLASELGISKDLVHRVWREADLKPHRLEGYMASNDPDFETKAADVLGLYLDPPRHAAIFSVDEKTAMQALDRRDRVLPLSPGRAERHGFEYKRNGTLSLYAGLDSDRPHSEASQPFCSSRWSAGNSEPGLTSKAPRVICSTRRAIPRPWFGSHVRARRIRRSSVPRIKSVLGIAPLRSTVTYRMSILENTSDVSNFNRRLGAALCDGRIW